MLAKFLPCRGRGHDFETMRTKAVLVLLTASVCAASVAAAVAKPTLRVTDTDPFTVRGAHFRPSERVLLIVRTKVKRERTVTAGDQGAFVARFRRVRIGSCPSYSVVATGNKGSRASFKLRGVDCPPPGPLG
jgi:hypothetical protein